MLLQNNLSQSIEQTVKAEDTVAKLFTWAEKEFGQEGISSLLQLADRWDTAKLDNHGSVRKLRQKILDIQKGYARVGPEHKLPANHLTVHFVRGLGKKYEAWAQVFWTSHTEKLPELTDVIRIMKAQEFRIKGDQSTGNSVPAMAAKPYRSTGHKRTATETPIEGEDAVMMRVPICSHYGKR
ncbi:hypothetical protein DL769_011069 [Monosporascus sp. CRB-8-3]|nr:hypothetical protein DL769_011069 [Monosporascus sp. CRB-8-3]